MPPIDRQAVVVGEAKRVTEVSTGVSKPVECAAPCCDLLDAVTEADLIQGYGVAADGGAS